MSYCNEAKGSWEWAWRGGWEVLAGEKGSRASGQVGTQTKQSCRARQRGGFSLREVLSPPALCSCPSARHVTWPFMITHVECVHIPVEQSRFVTGWTTPATSDGSETMWKEVCCGLPWAPSSAMSCPTTSWECGPLGWRQAGCHLPMTFSWKKLRLFWVMGMDPNNLSDGLTQPRINAEFYSGISQTYTYVGRWLWLCSVIFRRKIGGIQVLICRSEWMTCEAVRKHH